MKTHLTKSRNHFTSASVHSDFLARLSRVTSRARVCLHLFPPCVLLSLLPPWFCPCNGDSRLPLIYIYIYSAISTLEVIGWNWCLLMNLKEMKIKYISLIEVSDRFPQGSLFRDVFFFLFLSSYFSLMMEFIVPRNLVLGNTIIFILNVDFTLLIYFINILL